MTTDGFFLGLCGISLPRWSLSADSLTRSWIWILRAISLLPVIYVAIATRLYRQNIKELPDATNAIETQERRKIDQTFLMIYATVGYIIPYLELV